MCFYKIRNTVCTYGYTVKYMFWSFIQSFGCFKSLPLHFVALLGCSQISFQQEPTGFDYKLAPCACLKKEKEKKKASFRLTQVHVGQFWTLPG